MTLFYFKMLIIKHFAGFIKAWVGILVKLVRLRQFDSMYIRNLFHEHVSQ